MERYDYAYERNGMSNLFMVLAPFEGWPHIKVTDRRIQVDFAYCLEDMLTWYDPDAEKVTMGMDNLPTHHPASRYEAFEAAEARSRLERCDVHYTPTHGSWLHMADIEPSALQRQGLDRRIPDPETLRDEMAAWAERRDAQAVRVNRRFTPADARIRLKRLSPSIQT